VSAHHLVEREQTERGLGLSHEHAQPLDHVPCAPVVLHDVIEDFCDLGIVHRLAGEDPSGRLGVAENRGQGLHQLVRERGRHRADVGHARHVHELVSLLSKLSFGAPLLRDVAHDGDGAFAPADSQGTRRPDCLQRAAVSSAHLDDRVGISGWPRRRRSAIRQEARVLQRGVNEVG
jgi:hypothetical protein